MTTRNTPSCEGRDDQADREEQLAWEISYYTGRLVELEHSGYANDNAAYSSCEGELRRRWRERSESMNRRAIQARGR